MFRSVFILVLVLTFSTGVSTYDPAAILICNGCQFVMSFIETHLKSIEMVNRTDLTAFADAACARKPDLEIFNTLCTTVKDDLIDVAVQIIEGLERQISGNVTCVALRLCNAP